MGSLLFVYDADGTLVAQLADAVHKALKPATYNCDLCALTYGNLRMKPQWRSFVQALDEEVLFEHRDKFRRDHPTLESHPLPAVFRQDADESEWTPFITHDEFVFIRTLDDLELLVTSRLANSGDRREAK